MFDFIRQSENETRSDSRYVNSWFFLPFVCGTFLLIAYIASQMAKPFQLGQPLTIHLDVMYLPYYLLRTIMRMFLALAVSLLFSFIFAALTTRFKTAERWMIPLLDVLQSVPILGFQAIAVAPFIALFPGNLLGVECAAIFAIFTSQAWNMAFSLYQSFKTIPAELNEAAKIFHMSGWHRFWRLDLPFALPGLLWNMMMSMSGGWFFLVAAEAISVAGQDIKLPGIGSYIAVAIEQQNYFAIAWAMLTMLAGILLYDQLFFRPLLVWADKFKFDESENARVPKSFFLNWLRQNLIFIRCGEKLIKIFNRVIIAIPKTGREFIHPRSNSGNKMVARFMNVTFIILALLGTIRLISFIHLEVGLHELLHVVTLGLYTLVRVLLLILCASIFWVPIAVGIGLNPKYASRMQGVAQFLAAFPVNLMFPAVVFVIVHFQLNPDLWLSPLMVFGTQWYILFNVVAGASVIPSELRYAAKNLGVTGWLKWKRIYLPAIFPAYVTGAITACGGSWNASIVAEYVSWGKTDLFATGIGSYIKQMTDMGDFPRIALGISVMCIFVMLLNRFFWRKLYQLAESSR